jgi:TolB protein
MRDGNWELYRVNVSGGFIDRLTDTDDFEIFPNLSPDGEQITYMHTRGPGTSIHVAIVDADGENRIDLPGEGFVNEDPQWSPDGEWIVFQSNRDGQFEIYLMRADGSQQIRLTTTTEGAYWPTWGP